MEYGLSLYNTLYYRGILFKAMPLFQLHFFLFGTFTILVYPSAFFASHTKKENLKNEKRFYKKRLFFTTF